MLVILPGRPGGIRGVRTCLNRQLPDRISIRCPIESLVQIAWRAQRKGTFRVIARPRRNSIPERGGNAKSALFEKPVGRIGIYKMKAKSGPKSPKAWVAISHGRIPKELSPSQTRHLDHWDPRCVKFANWEMRRNQAPISLMPRKYLAAHREIPK